MGRRGSISATHEQSRPRGRTFDGAQPSCVPRLMSHHPPLSLVTTSTSSSLVSANSPGWSVSNVKSLRKLSSAMCWRD